MFDLEFSFRMKRRRPSGPNARGPRTFDMRKLLLLAVAVGVLAIARFVLGIDPGILLSFVM